MPLERCKENGKSGWRYGSGGVCYTGKDAKKQAIKQGLAIDGPEKFKKEMKKTKAGDAPTPEEIEEALAEHDEENGSYTDNLISDVEKNLRRGRHEE